MKQCTYCGQENADNSPTCPGCGTDFSESISSVDKSPSAGFGIRALARIIDAICALFVGFAAGMIAGIILGILNSLGLLPAGWHHHLRGLSLISVGFGFLGSLLYHLLCEGIHGATLGKLCCGICVVSANGKPSTIKGAFIRSLGYYIDALFFGLVGYESMKKSPINQRYGDKWAGTAVFKTKEIPPELKRTPGYLILGLLLGIGSWIVMLVLGFVLRVL